MTPCTVPAGFDALAKLTALESLAVGYTAAPQASILQWTTLRRMRMLSLDSCALEDRRDALCWHSNRMNVQLQQHVIYASLWRAVGCADPGHKTLSGSQHGIAQLLPADACLLQGSGSPAAHASLGGGGPVRYHCQQRSSGGAAALQSPPALHQPILLRRAYKLSKFMEGHCLHHPSALLHREIQHSVLCDAAEIGHC